jgi:hypothetical protein
MFRFLQASRASERMKELGRFLEFWYGKRRSEYGEPPEVLSGMVLPYPLRRFYALAGRWPSPEPERMAYFYTGSGGHHLRQLDQLAQTPDGRVNFFMEYQGDWDGVTLARGTDPPVWIQGYWDDPADDELDDDERDAMPPKVKQVSDALSRFLITHCLMTTLYEDENSPCSVSGERGNLIDFFNQYPQWAVRIWDVEEGSCPSYEGSFYLFQDCVLVHRIGSFYRFGTRHPQGIRLMVSHLEL